MIQTRVERIFCRHIERAKDRARFQRVNRRRENAFGSVTNECVRMYRCFSWSSLQRVFAYVSSAHRYHGATIHIVCCLAYTATHIRVWVRGRTNVDISCNRIFWMYIRTAVFVHQSAIVCGHVLTHSQYTLVIPCEKILCASVSLIPKRASKSHIKRVVRFRIDQMKYMCLAQSHRVEIQFSHTQTHMQTTHTLFEGALKCVYKIWIPLLHYILSTVNWATQSARKRDVVSASKWQKKKWSEGKMLTRRNCIYFNVVCASLLIIISTEKWELKISKKYHFDFESFSLMICECDYEAFIFNAEKLR